MSQVKGIEAYPLQWPAGWRRATYARHSKFAVTSDSFARTRDGLLHEIHLMGGRQIVLSTNIPLNQSGLPYAKHAQPKDPGVAVYFARQGKPMALACDKYKTVVENVRALQLTVEAMRGIERWGSSELMERTFTGFTALPPPPGDPQPTSWRSILGFQELTTPTMQMVKDRRNELSRKFHPDIGTTPSSQRMAEVNNAFEKAQEELGL